MTSSTDLLDSPTAQSKITLSVGAVRFAALLAGLVNASCREPQTRRRPFHMYDVGIALEHYRRITNPDARIDSADFVRQLLRGVTVTVITWRGDVPDLIDVTEYDAAHGNGAAEEVLQHILRHKNTLTAHLCRYEPEPASWPAIIGSLALVGLMMWLLVKFALLHRV